jgi:phage FluMu gp28-like protein
VTAATITPLTRRKSGKGRVLLPYQVDWCNDLSRMKLWVKSRRIGADYCEAYDAIEKRINRASKGFRRSHYWYSSADESAAYETAEYWRYWAGVFNTVVDHFTDDILDPKTGKTGTSFCVQLPNDGPRLTAMTSNPRRFRSKGGDVCLSEIAFHDDPREMHKAAYPTITWGDSYKALSTHNGEGGILDQWEKMARRHIAGDPRTGDIPWRLHHITILDAVADGLVDKINEIKGTDFTDEQFLADLRAGCETEDQWNEEYMAVPSMDSVAWLPYDLIEPCEDDAAGDPLRFGDGPRYLGADIGEHKDPSTFWWGELVGDIMWVRERRKMRGIPLSQLEEMIIERLRHPKTVRGCVDATGLGTQIGQAAEKTGKGEAIKFTLPVMDQIASPMRGRFEDRRIRIPAVREVREDLHSIRMERTASGSPRFVAPRTEAGHADEFWACGLMLHAAGNTNPVPKASHL